MNDTDPFEQRPRPPRPFFLFHPRFLWIISTVVVIASLVVTVRYGILLVNQQRTAAVVARLDRDDPGWRLERIEADRKAIPESKNSAIPLLEANRLIPTNWPQTLATQLPRGPSPISDDPSRVIVPLIDTDYFPPPDEKQVAALRAELAALAPALGEARKVVDKPEGRYPLTFALDPLATLLPHAQAARNTARLLKLDAILRVHDGDIEGALDSSRAIMNVGRSLGDEPFLITQLVRIVVGSVAIRSLQRVLAAGEPSDEALAVVQGLLEDEESQPLFRHGVRGERGMLDVLFARLASGELTKLHEEELSPTLHWIYAASMHTYAQGVAVEEMGGAVAVAEARPSQQQSLAASWNQGLSKRFAAGLWDKHACKLMPDITGFVDSYVASKARLRAAIVAVAAERYRRRHGRWPVAIGELAPWPLAQITADPHTDRPLIWSLDEDDDSLTIYSPGPDLVDNGGMLEQDPPDNSGPGGKPRRKKWAWEYLDVGFRLRGPASRRQAISSKDGPPSPSISLP